MMPFRKIEENRNTDYYEPLVAEQKRAIKKLERRIFEFEVREKYRDTKPLEEEN